MKTLFILRHAKSSWKNEMLDDHNRPLNKRGKRNAPFMANLILNAGFPIQKIISSSAVRAIDTASAFADVLHLEDEDILIRKKLYHASALRTAGIVANFPEEFDTLLLVGHNPGLQEFLENYSDWQEDNLATCALVGLRIGDTWASVLEKQATQFFYEFPRKYFPKNEDTL
jgi:phosphohistidine phosphatase